MFRIVVVLLFLILSLLSLPAQAGSFSTHVIVGDLIGRYSYNETEAFVLGFLSHAILDEIEPHNYAPDWLSWNLVTKDYDFVLLDFLISSTRIIDALQSNDNTRVWGILGAILPDLIDTVYALAFPEAWKKGDLIMPWHRSVDRSVRRMSKEETMLVGLFLHGTF